MKYVVTVAGRTLEVVVNGDAIQVDGADVRAALAQVPGIPVRQLVLDGTARSLSMVRGEEGWSVQLGGESWVVEVEDERTRQLKALTGQQGRRAGGGVVRAPMPGLVLRVEVEQGQTVSAGTGLVVLEAMKMENEITAPAGGVVQAIRVAAGEAVEKGAPLVEVVDPEA
ncbi:MAG: biotin/lipoyl-binding protein [Gemmatimonadales bacterium]|jgi:pyruvate carboxylase subunit B